MLDQDTLERVPREAVSELVQEVFLHILVRRARCNYENNDWMKLSGSNRIRSSIFSPTPT
jgi:hypothetical protein